jgi:hypothetical protein
MMHLAMYEAVNSVDGAHQAYRNYFACPSGTNKQAAAAVAARNVLASLYPAQAATFDARLATHLSAIPDSASKFDGITLGGQSAAAMGALRSGDGSSNPPPAVADGTLPGQWRRTPPAFQDPALPQWPGVTPFGIQSAGQFASPPPPALSSAEYAAAYNEAKELGSATSATRTQYQTDTAFLWRGGPNTVTPPGQWLQIAEQVAVQRSQSLDENARMFALLGMSVADAGVAAWDTKYAQLYWRPITGIRLGASDGNDATIEDAGWTPLFETPNHPSYVSGHSTFSAAAARMLTRWVGGDAFNFTVTGDGITRPYASFDAALQDAGMSRIYGGIHWQFDNTAGQAIGNGVGDWIIDHYLQVPAPSVLGMLAAGGLVALRRRR